MRKNMTATIVWFTIMGCLLTQSPVLADDDAQELAKIKDSAEQIEAFLAKKPDSASAEKAVSMLDYLYLKEIKEGKGKDHFTIEVPKDTYAQLSKEFVETGLDMQKVSALQEKYSRTDSPWFLMFMKRQNLTFGDGTSLYTAGEAPWEEKSRSDFEIDARGDYKSDIIHRFSGKVTLGKYVFQGEGDKLHTLTFALLGRNLLFSGNKYVYLRGRGKVELPGGKVVTLGEAKKKEPASKEKDNTSSSLKENMELPVILKGRVEKKMVKATEGKDFTVTTDGPGDIGIGNVQMLATFISATECRTGKGDLLEKIKGVSLEVTGKKTEEVGRFDEKEIEVTGKLKEGWKSIEVESVSTKAGTK